MSNFLLVAGFPIGGASRSETSVRLFPRTDLDEGVLPTMRFSVRARALIGLAATNALNGSYTDATLGRAGTISADSDTAVTFPTSGSKAEVADSSSLDLSGSFTVEASVKMPSGFDASKIRNFVNKGNDAYGGNFQLRMRQDSSVYKFEFRYRKPGLSSAEAVLCSTAITADRYYHVVGVFEAGVARRIYVDGSLCTSQTTTLTGAATNDDPFRIGHAASTNALEGTVDDVAVYASALSAARISSHYSWRAQA